MDCASSSRRLVWKTRRGCRGLGRIWSIGMVREDSRGSAGVGGTGASGGGGGRGGKSAPIPLPRARRGCSGLCMVEDLFGELDIAFRPLGSGVIGEDGLAETGGFGQPDASGDDGAEDLILEELPEVGRYMVRRIPSMARGCWKESRIRSMVSMSSETPSRAKNSHWMGTSTESAAMRALSVRRSRAGGQSM